MTPPPICPYCGEPAKLVTGAELYKNRSRPDLDELKFWQCAPCDAYVGCHKKGHGPGHTRGDGTVPLGRLANSTLRMWKGNAHIVFDAFWKGWKYAERRKVARSAAYQRLARDLGIDPKDCHIGMFDVETCKRVIQICAKWRADKEIAF